MVKILSMNEQLPVFVPIRRQYFGGVRRQTGRGFLSVFGNILSKLLPFAKQFILPSIASAAQNITSDIASGDKPFKESLKKHSMGALKGMARSYLDQKGSGRKRKRTRTKSVAKKKQIKRPKKAKIRRHKRKINTTWNPTIVSVPTKKTKRKIKKPKRHLFQPSPP